MWHQTARLHDVQQMRRHRFAGERLAGRQIGDLTGRGIDVEPVAARDALDLVTDQDRQTVVERVAVEDAGEGAGRRVGERSPRRCGGGGFR